MSQAFTQGFIIKDGARVIDSSTGALTVQGNVNIGANFLNFTNTLIKQEDANTISVKNSADDTYRGLYCGILYLQTGVTYQTSTGAFNARNDDDDYVLFKARDNGVGLVEVARLQGAAAPAFCVGNSGVTANDDFAAIADQVKLGNYDIAAGRRTLALATEEAVAIEAALASTHTLAVRINGATYRIMLTNA